MVELAVDYRVTPALGAVYTRGWVVELMLDLAGYQASRNLVDARAVEPAVGEGAFLVPLVVRLLASCWRQRRPWLDCRAAVRAYDVDTAALRQCRRRLQSVLAEAGVPETEAAMLLDAWLVAADYLLLAPAPVTQTPGLFDAPVAEKVDFVLGNPPYVRVESIPEVLNAQYRRRLPTMRGRADLYVGFYEAALRQLRPGGVCAFLCADRWMVNQYGEALRRFIAEGFAVDTLVEMHEAAVFEDEVSAYPAISLIRRGSQGLVVIATATRQLAEVPAPAAAAYLAAVRQGEPTEAPGGLVAGRLSDWFAGGQAWLRTTPARLALLAHLEQHFAPLVSAATGTRVGIGIATGPDAVFFTPDADLVEASQQLRLARPADVRTGQLRWGGQWLLSPWHQGRLVDLAQRPRLREHLTRHQTQLAQRHVGRKNPAAWYRTIDKVDEALYRQPKLYIPDIKNTLFPVLDRGETYPDHNLYFITSEAWDLEVLGGLLLSDVGTFFVACYGVRMRGGYLRMQAQYLRKIRVPAPQVLTPAQAAALRQAFRIRDVAAATEAAVAVYGIAHLWPPVQAG